MFHEANVGVLRVNESRYFDTQSTGYRVFSIRSPRCLFQTWPGGAGVYLNPPVYPNAAFIKQRFLFIIFDKDVCG